MTTLVSFLSTGKGSWGHVSRVIDGQEWEKVILITNEYGKENFNQKDNTELIVVDFNKGITEVRDEIAEILKKKVDSEVAVNFVSGAGKEHMAFISALMKSGLGFRLVALTKDGVEEI